MRLLCTLLAALPLTQASVPGTFFWKPRVGLDIAVPTPATRVLNKPTWSNIAAGYVVMIDGYQAGITIIGLVSYLEDVREAYPHLHFGMGPYYTNVYRWAVRYISLLPEWFSSKQSNYVSTHRVWKKRYFYLDYFVPKWMRKIFFFVDDASWKYEEWEWRKFVRHGEPHFSKFHVYPSKIFNNYKSMRQQNTVENLDLTDNSIDM